MKEFINIMICSPVLIALANNTPLVVSIIGSVVVLLSMHHFLYRVLPRIIVRLLTTERK